MAGPAAQLDEAKRFAEIVAILQKHHLVQGLTPEKVRDIFVDLGPTFVKFGQILSMRSDILPKEYCAALETLRTDVTPMPLTEVEDILTQAYARPWQEIFSDIGIRPLGSASIAQVHAATLTDGQRVVVKVQRPDLYDIMSRDVRLLKRAAALLKYTPLASALDFHAVLDEIWHTVQEELDFTIEANNIAEFKRLNDGVAYADCPATFPKWCTKNVLVMEYIAGHRSTMLTACAPTGMISTRSPSSSCTTTSARSRSTASSTPTPIPATSACRAGRSSGSTSA